MRLLLKCIGAVLVVWQGGALALFLLSSILETPGHTPLGGHALPWIAIKLAATSLGVWVWRSGSKVRQRDDREPWDAHASILDRGFKPDEHHAAPAAQYTANLASTSVASVGVPEESLWALALREFEGGNRRAGLWARVYAEADGHESQAKAAYLRARVHELAVEQQMQATSP